MAAGEGSWVERAWSVLSGGEQFRSKAGWGSIGVDREVPDVGLEIGRVPGTQEIPFLGKSKVGRGSRGRSNRCRELSPWAGIMCVWGGILLSMTVCVTAQGSLIGGPGGSGALAEGCQGPQSGESLS